MTIDDFNLALCKLTRVYEIAPKLKEVCELR